MRSVAACPPTGWGWPPARVCPDVSSTLMVDNDGSGCSLKVMTTWVGERAKVAPAGGSDVVSRACA